MPLFEYRCLTCDSQFELLIRGSMTPTCPSCGSASLERIISMFAVSSDGTQRRSRQLLGAKQKEQSQRNSAEREFYKHDHHDD
jgi:putative FmdB family regulatory protein